MKITRVGVIIILVMFTSTVSAGVVSFDMNLAWNGAPPGLPGPWLNATFDDGGTAGSVTLTITAGNLTGTEKVKKCYFNLDPLLNPSDLNFSAPTLLSGSFDDPNATTGTNIFKADGDGFFDIQIEFETADGGTHSFDAGDAVRYTIDNIATLTAGSFDFISFPDGGQGVFPVVGHILGIEDIGQGDSGWVSVPEPATLILLGFGGLVLLGKRR